MGRLHSNMLEAHSSMNSTKRGLSTLEYLGAAILVIVLLFVLIRVGVIPLPKLGEEVIKLAPAQDRTCLTSTEVKKNLGETPRDIDEDGRADSCDACVCERGQGCHNDDNDADGDKLATLCDKDDTAGRGATVQEFNPDKCIEGRTLFVRGLTKQCFPTP